MSDGIELILADHARVAGLFEQYVASGDGVFVGLILDTLTAHDSVEHAALYPLANSVLGKVGSVERLDLAHMQVKSLMDHVRVLEGPALLDAVSALRLAVMDHVQDEEKNLLPALRKKATPAQLETLAARIEQNKQRVG